MTKVIRAIGIAVGTIMAIGAMFGALNTMFAAVAARAREIATLRAIGFPGLPVVVAVMLETMLLALIGGLIGGVPRLADLQRLQRLDHGRRLGRPARVPAPRDARAALDRASSGRWRSASSAACSRRCGRRACR
jgi:hypothetical protein